MKGKQFKTAQEAQWHGSFGDEYTKRCDDYSFVAKRTGIFAKILSRTSDVDSVVEFGSNTGANIFAIKRLLPNCGVTAIEINKNAADLLKERYETVYEDEICVMNQSLLDFDINFQKKMSIVFGVLMILEPCMLRDVYQKLYDATSKYILIAEYYNPTPLEVAYRGGVLIKRDFAGEMLDMFSNLRLVDYGFVYHRDTCFPEGDITWFLLEKEKS